MSSTVRNVAVVTGSRAEYGLLRPVMRAIEQRSDLALEVVVAGCHLLPPALTVDEVAEEFTISARIPMQRPGRHDRPSEAEALGRGVQELARHFAAGRPDVVLVLGDRVEAFAAAAAASVGGTRVAHLHGGDRAEGIADEALRHAITKLAHIHLPATETSARRIVSMGEEPHRVHVVGSPAIDDLGSVPALDEGEHQELGKPRVVFLLHPDGATETEIDRTARCAMRCCRESGPTLALHPNHDPGRDVIVQAIAGSGCPERPHLPRQRFIGLLRRADVLVGNSSAGLIECAALGVPCVNLGPRQAGRERAGNVIDVEDVTEASVRAALAEALCRGRIEEPEHPYGDGRAGPRTAELLATLDLEAHGLAKRNTY